jgi:hypothetical protein
MIYGWSGQTTSEDMSCFLHTKVECENTVFIIALKSHTFGTLEQDYLSQEREPPMDKNRELCELLGICWHEQPNPDFTTDAGKVRLLRILRNRDDWHKFAKFCGFDEIQANSLFRIDYILDTTGRLRDKAIAFLKEKG